MKSPKPHLLITTAKNDLAGVATESRKIFEIVKDVANITVTELQDTTIETLADTLLEISDQLFMIHYGGHADQNNIVLDGFYNLDKIRLSRILIPSDKHSPDIIFLNGCLSFPHVGVLMAKGVKAVIATNVSIDDLEAVRLANYFYKAFFTKKLSLKEAFEFAESTVRGENSNITVVNPGEIDDNTKINSSWTLFINSRTSEIMDKNYQEIINISDTENDEIINGKPKSNERKRMKEALNLGFTEDELNNLCFDHSNEIFEEFSKEKGKASKIRFLISFFERRGALEELERIIKLERPQ